MPTNRLAYASLALLLACGTAPGDYTGGGSPGGGSFPPGAPGTPPGGGGLGVTPGGAQDIGYARELIASGLVPAEGDFPVEGLLSEHDLPTPGPACNALICLRPSLGVARSLETGQLEAWLHIGMVSGLPAAEFERPPLDVVVAIDKSSSMSIDMTETTEAVARLVGKLRADDRIAVIAFDDSLHTIHAFGPVGDAAALQQAVRAIPAGGAWNIQAAVDAAYDILEAQSGPTRLRRVMVFSCGYPGISADRSDPFSRAVGDGARAGIGMSFFGVLLGWSPELGALLGEASGGAFYYLTDLERVVQVFDHELDLMVTPAAYDLHIGLALAAGFQIAKSYGIPGDAVGATGYEIDVATAFFSKRRGAVVIRLSRGGPGVDVGTAELSYRPEPALGWSAAEEQSVAIRAPMASSWDEAFAQSLGVRKAAALVNQAVRMAEACRRYHAGDAAGARAALAELAAYLAAEAEALNDDPMRAEVELVEQLIANMGG